MADSANISFALSVAATKIDPREQDRAVTARVVVTAFLEKAAENGDEDTARAAASLKDLL